MPRAAGGHRWLRVSARSAPVVLAAAAVLVAVLVVVLGLVVRGGGGSDPRPRVQPSAPSADSTPTEPAPSSAESDTREDGTTPATLGSPSDVRAAAGLLDAGGLEPSTSVTVTDNGAVVENLDVSGVVNVNADDVTIRNVRVRSTSSAFGINVHKGADGTVIEHVEVEMGVDGSTANAAIGGAGGAAPEGAQEPGDNIVVRFSHLHGNADGIKAADYGLYEGNYIAMRRSEGSEKHIDGIQGSGSSNWTARYNWVDQAYAPGHNAAIFLQSYTGKQDKVVQDVVVEKNWVNGGVYTVAFENGKKASGSFLQDVVVRDNVFYRDFKYGAYRPEGSGVRGNGGVWADSGDPVPVGRVQS